MYDHHDDEDHDRGLAFDLQTISKQVVARRKAIAWMGGAGATALLASCGGGSGSSGTGTTTGTTSSSSSSSTGSTSSSASSTSSSSSSSSSSSTSGTCVADASETNGPYPADGTNSSSGASSNVLTQSGVVRSDIRASFISSTTTAQGIAVTLTLTLVNANASCAPLVGYAVYIWHCDAAGLYSLYTAPTESYLRGVQVTDSNGQVTFTTIFPGCYSGRFPHIHVEVFTSLSAATSGRASKLITQIAPPSAVCSTVYNGASGYSASIRNFAQTSLSSDNVFGDNTTAQNNQMTMTMAGSVSAGYTATNTIGIAV